VRRYAARILRIAVVVAILVGLVLFARTIDWKETWLAMRSASPAILALAAIANILSLMLKGVRWWIFLRSIGIPSLWLATRATFAGAALNNILIANSGDAARVVLVSRAANTPSAKVLATLALERLFEIVGFVILLAAAVTFLVLPPALERMRVFAIIVLVLVVVLLVYLVRHPEKSDVPVIQEEGLLHRARAYTRRFARTMTNISTAPRFVGSLVITMAVWALQVVSYELTAMAAGFEIPTVGTIAAMLIVNLGFAIRATPGNVGVFQWMYAVTAAAFGMDRDQAIGVALLIQMQQMIPVTILGLLAAPRMLIGLGRERSGDSVRPAEPESGGRLHGV
jgi:uncharacterized protein (TIRG00374 family)